MADEIYNPSGVTDAPPSAEVIAQVEAGKAKLAEMLKGGTTAAPASTRYVPTAGQRQQAAAAAEKTREPQEDRPYRDYTRVHPNDDVPDGRTVSTPGAARVAAREAAASPDETRRLALTKDLTSGNLTAAERAQKTAELRELVASMATQEERQAFVDLPIETIRDAMGVQAPDLVPSLVEKWDVDGEAEILAGLHDAGVAPETARVLHNWYVGVFQGAMGDVANLNVETMEADFRCLGKKHGVKPAAVEALVKAHRARLA